MISTSNQSGLVNVLLIDFEYFVPSEPMSEDGFACVEITCTLDLEK